MLLSVCVSLVQRGNSGVILRRPYSKPGVVGPGSPLWDFDKVCVYPGLTCGESQRGDVGGRRQTCGSYRRRLPSPLLLLG